jgi:perosamine synthetase
LTGNESKYVNECLESTWISSKGEFIERFEKDFSRYSTIKHTVAVSNGTVALHLALLALGIGPGDEVIVPAFTYVASVNAIVYVGAKPIFVDSLSDSWQMDPSQIKDRITGSTKAIMAVHVYGQPCEMDDIMSIAKENGLMVIEDCAEALGSIYKGKHVGSFGDISTFSFFGNKTITTGEGGMVATNTAALADKVTSLKGQGLAKGKEYWHDVLGYNYRMTNICAAIGVAQLERIDLFERRKQKIAKLYESLFEKIEGVTFHKKVGDVNHSYWMCSVLFRSQAQRDRARSALASKGIETRPLFPPVNLMPMHEDGQNYPVAENLAKRGINLPSWPGLTDKQVQYIADTIQNALEEK